MFIGPNVSQHWKSVHNQGVAEKTSGNGKRSGNNVRNVAFPRWNTHLSRLLASIVRRCCVLSFHSHLTPLASFFLKGLSVPYPELSRAFAERAPLFFVVTTRALSILLFSRFCFSNALPGSNSLPPILHFPCYLQKDTFVDYTKKPRTSKSLFAGFSLSTFNLKQCCCGECFRWKVPFCMALLIIWTFAEFSQQYERCNYTDNRLGIESFTQPILFIPNSVSAKNPYWGRNMQNSQASWSFEAITRDKCNY